MNTVKPAGVILAGGRSSRLGGTRKALRELNGRTLLTHVVDSLKAHTDPLLLSCESETVDFDDYGLTLVADLLPSYRGPLTGLYSALQYLADEGLNKGLVLCPCDAPFIPPNLVQTLLDATEGENKPVVVVSYQGVLQPTFSLWQKHHLPVVGEAVLSESGIGIKHVLDLLPHIIVEWACSEPPPFFNVNTPKDLQAAGLWLDRAGL